MNTEYFFGLLLVLLILFSVGGVCAADTNDTVLSLNNTNEHTIDTNDELIRQECIAVCAATIGYSLIGFTICLL